ncbi:COX15/CtaA family protein [Methylocystis sp. 9N]|uniref:Heme A synthase n=1 Tax=Methylocystis borbori TaxID=3118750 RepID=A0ABU7XFS5_9HYPH
MEDWLHFPHPVPAIKPYATEENAIAVRNWLWLVAALVFLMVIVGGATRLTESGLSIVQWKPVTGVLPPLSHKEWLEAFDEYKQIPQYKELFPNMDLVGFKYIYAWEWAHRLLGRLIGAVFAIPLIWFWASGRLPRSIKPKLLGIFALGALQGGVGWWMVASGLVKRVEVAQERLAIHLILAALIFSACLWVAGGLGPRARSVVHEGAGRLKATALVLLTLAFVQIFVGGLVAGLRAGLVNNTWPLMDGVFIPSGDVLWSLEPIWVNLVDNPVTVQFFHRMIAYAIFVLAFGHLVDALLNAEGRARRGAIIVFGHVVMQIALGVGTLVLVEPPFDGTPHLLLALAHQAVGMAVLAVATLQARRLTQDILSN